MTSTSARTLDSTIDQPMSRTIGKIVKSNTHIDYVCQVYCRGEVEQLPQPTDFALGAFVTIELAPPAAPSHLNGIGHANGNSHANGNGDMARLVGVIYNTILLNPDFGSLGPRLSQSSELEIFSPDYLAETATLVGIIALGWQTTDGCFRQGVPGLAATINTGVTCLEEEDLVAFHTAPSSNAHTGSVCLHYVPTLLNTKSPLIAPLLLNIVDQLVLLFPEQKRGLAVMRDNLAWRTIVEPVR